MKFLPHSSKFTIYTTPLIASALLTSCLDEEGGLVKDFDEQMEGLAFDINRTQMFLDEEKETLANYEKAAADNALVKGLQGDLEKITSEVEAATARNSELADEVELTTVEFDQHRARFRKMVREATIGTNVDLSATKGDDYKSVRVLGIDPTAVKVYRSAGPEPVAIKDLPPALIEKLQMSEEEAALYREKLASTAVAQAKRYRAWKKEKKVEKKDDASKEAILVRMKEIRLAIYNREQMIGRRMRMIKAWKSKASQLDARVAEERAQGRRQKSGKLARLARDKADLLADQNNDSWVVIEGLKGELDDLERLEKAQ